jgi:hypothetical protein
VRSVLTMAVASAIISAKSICGAASGPTGRNESSMAKAKNNDFDEFVKRQGALAEAETVDWDKEREEWLGDLDALYSKIEAFLKEYVAKGSIKLDFEEVQLNERSIGIYNARKMIIHIGRQQIGLTPIGRSIIGAKGRVDVEGSAGKARLLLVDKDATSATSLVKVTVIDPKRPSKSDKQASKDIEWTWKIATSPPVMAFLELNKDSFFQVLMEVSNA